MRPQKDLIKSEERKVKAAPVFFQDGDYESDCLVKVDDCGFFIYWKSEPRVSSTRGC